MPEFQGMTGLYSFEQARNQKIPCAVAPPEEMCDFCQAPIVFRGILKEGKISRWVPLTCHCREAREHAEIKQEQEWQETLRKLKQEEWQRQLRLKAAASGLSRRFKKRCFDNYVCATEQQTRVLETARRYAVAYERLKDAEQNGLFLYGGCGCGKTHLACSVANHLLGLGVGCKFTTFEDILLEIKSSYGNGEGTADLTIREQYKTVDFLILDDLGKEKSTEFTVQVLFDLIKTRYEKGLPTLITSNYNRQELAKRLTVKEDELTAKAIVSRIYEMCFAVSMAGMGDYRKR